MKRYVLGEFADAGRMLEVASQLRREGDTDLDAHSPYPLHGAEAALFLPKSPVPLFAFGGGLAGVLTAYGVQYYTTAIAWPINVANRPPHSPAAFVPITFELMVLFAAFAIFFGLMALWRLPRPHHPVFECEEFRSAATHAFWISVRADAARVDEVQKKLQQGGASHVAVVEEEEE